MVVNYVYAKFYENPNNRLACSRISFWTHGTSGIIGNTKSQKKFTITIRSLYTRMSERKP